MRALSIPLLAALLTTSPWLRAQTCVRDCAQDLRCEIEVTDCLLAAGHAREAIDRLKPLVQTTGEPVLARDLARAYLADDNPFWAQRTLVAATTHDPQDCDSHAWLAYLAMGEGFLDQAEEHLAATGCPQDDATRARWSLLRASLARLRDDHPATLEALDQVRAAPQIFAEDVGMWHQLRAREDPGWIEPLSGHAELAAGYSSNAAAGSPTDAAARGPASGIGRLDAHGRLALPLLNALRPLLEAGGRGHGVVLDEASDLSYLELKLRGGLLIGRAAPRLSVWYVPDLLLLNSEERPWFYTAHRAELELELTRLSLFAGAGRRIFVDAGRSRWEFDGGVGGRVAALARVHLLAAASARYALADDVAYDQVGYTGLITAQSDLGRGAFARLGLTAAGDYFPSSGGEHGMTVFAIPDKRSDLLLRVSAALWSPTWAGLRLGASLELAARDSSADAPRLNFDYTEQRALIRLRWSWQGDPWAPPVTTPAAHAPLPYSIDEQQRFGFDEGRIQDLLRQEESDMRGLCGCGS